MSPLLILQGMKSFYKNLKLEYKIMLIMAIVFVVLWGFQKTQTEYYKYQAIVEKAKLYDEYLDQVEKADENIEKELIKGEETTKRTKKKHTQIDTKLKQDEKIIDSNDVTDDKRKRFLSKHGED